MLDEDNLAELLDPLVIPDRKSAAGNVDREATLKALAAILEGGRANLVGLVGRLNEAGKKDDSKARYALHALAVHVAGLRDEKQRRAFAEALASTLAGDRPKEAKAFVVRQLQVVGGKEVAEALGKLLTDEDLCEPAAQALLAIRTGAAEQFRHALKSATGKCRFTVVHGLGTLCDTAAAETLRTLAIREKDQETRLVVVWALANMGDADSAEILLKAADAEGYERVKATGACLLLAERLVAAGKKDRAERIYEFIEKTRTEPNEKHFREAAIRGLATTK